MAKSLLWADEAAMVADFTAWCIRQGWKVYAETGGWDALLVREKDGFQIGVEAKKTLNAKVLCQVLEHDHAYSGGHGPDCWAILVPGQDVVHGLETIAARLGVVVIEGRAPDRHAWPKYDGPRFYPDLPDHGSRFSASDDMHRAWGWPEHCPDHRIKLPDYVPDVVGGRPSPLSLTPWKIKAIKAAVVLEFQGFITRQDFQALDLDSRRFTQFWLDPIGNKQWVASKSFPDFRRQHPVNYEQIKADIGRWLPAGLQSILPGVKK